MERCMENMTEKTVPTGQVVGTVFDNQSKYEKNRCWDVNWCSESVAIRLCPAQDVHFKIRKLSVAGYTTDDTL